MSDDAVPPPLDELLAHRQWVRALARRLVAADDQADDVEQTAWLAAIERPPSRTGPARVWLAVVLRNAARKLGRVEGRRARHEAAAPVRGADEPAEHLVAEAELQQQVGRAVLALDEPYRTAILLRFYDDLTPAEIATRLGIPVDTVRTRIRRAVETLRARLDREHGGRRAAWALPFLAWDGAGAGRGPAEFVGAVEGTAAHATAGVGTAAAVAGGLAMGIAKKVALAVVVLLVLAGGVALMRGLGGTGDPPIVAGPADTARARPSKHAPRAAPPSADADGDAIPGPVDLGLCDRDLDVHGVVVLADGTPVPGARVEAIAYPWRRATVLHGRDVASVGPRTRTARDGTFALRLTRGDLVSLRVEAAGLVDAEKPTCQAGERVRVTLHPGVRLRIEAVDAAAAPCAALRFRVFNHEGLDTLVVGREVTTDATGVAVAADLPPSLDVNVALLSNGVGDPSWTPVKLPASGEATQRIVVPPGRTIRGRATDAETGAPIAGARVGMGWTLRHEVATGADGTYALPGWTGTGVPEIAIHADRYEIGKETVATRDTVDFALRAGFAATGRIVGADGAPVAGALITVIASVRVGDDQRTSRGHVESAADGSFRVAGLARDLTHALIVVAPRHGRVGRDVRSPQTGDLALGDVALAAPRAIEGRVVNGHGEPVARAKVILIGSDAAATRPGVVSYGTVESRRTDDLGRFRFPDLAPGRYEVRVAMPKVPVVSETIDLAAGADVLDRTIVVGGGRAIVVRVADESGRALEGVSVHLAHVGASDPGAQSELRTEADGGARFVGLPRHVQVMARAPGGSSLLSASWRDVPDDAAEVAVVLRAARRLRVRVVDASDRAIARAVVRVFRRGEWDWWVTADAVGEFATLVPASGVGLDFSGVVDGEESGWTARCDTFPDGAETTLRCERIATDCTLRVRVETPDGEPVAGARVTATHRMWSRQRDSVSDAAGVAVFEGLPARELRVTATSVGAWVNPARLLIVPAGQEVVLVTRRGVALRGTLVRPGGEPVQGRVTVRLPVEQLGDFEELTSREADAQGRFVLLVPEGVGEPFDLSAHAEIDGLDIYAKASGVHPADDVRMTLRPAPPRGR